MSLRTILKRRKEGKTDYKARIALIRSGIPRIVIRKTNRYLIVQLVECKQAQDSVKITTKSSELVKYGFKEEFGGSLKSVPAAYLTGLLMAKKIKKGKHIIDNGMAVHKLGGRIYAVVKGLIDGGLEINADEKIFPSEERTNGEHLKEEVKENIKKVKEGILKNGK